MASVLNYHSDTLLIRPFQRRADMVCFSRIHHIHRILSNSTSPTTSCWIPCHTCSIRKNGIAGIVRPYRIVNAYRVICVKCRIEPLRANIVTNSLIVIRLRRITNRRRGNPANEPSRNSIVKGRPFSSRRPARALGSLSEVL
jgi:hypothetical protein